MSAVNDYRIVIGCEADRFPQQGSACHACLEMKFGPIEKDHVDAWTGLLIEGNSYGNWRRYYGANILHFANGLTSFHSQLRGSARLCDWDSLTVVCMTVINPSRGHIAIGCEFIPAMFWTDVHSEDSFLTPRLSTSEGGIRISIEGLVTDQSYLPPAIAGLKRFIAETGISTKMEW